MKRLIALSLSAVALAACSPDAAPFGPNAGLRSTADSPLSVGSGSTVIVTHGYASGKGSFSDAVARANADAKITRIEIKPANLTVRLAASVTYTGAQPLTISGKRSTIDASAVAGSALIANGGADLTLEDLTIRDASGEGLEMQVPTTAAGTITVVLRDFTAIGNDGHGVLINDQEQTETTDGVQPNGNGSAAALVVRVENVRFAENGYSVSDRDGLRVNEGGEGDLTFTAVNARSEDNAADGIELDERGNGSVLIDVRDTQILRNGKFDPEDLDDGFDIDEYDAGSISGTMIRTKANDNYEEGLDFNENNAGDLRVDLSEVEASRNREEGIDYEEDDDFAGGGDLVTTMVDIIANGNGADGGDAGLKIREKGVGDLEANVTRVQTSENVIGGISVREDAAGALRSTIVSANSFGNTGNGIDFDENSTGDLTATVNASSSTNNGGVGVRGDEASDGVGSLTLTGVTISGNVGGNTSGNVSPVITL